MRLTHTHTYVTMDVPADLYDIVRAKLLAASYEHAIDDKDGLLIMQGIALTKAAPGETYRAYNDPAVIARLLRALATGAQHIDTKNDIIFIAAAELLEAQAAGPITDTQRIDWLERAAKESPSGISFDRVPACHDERAGWRFMRQHFIGDPAKSLREAIDKAKLLEPSYRR
jgi:hypothetical protein